MALTRANVERVLIGRCAAALRQVGLDSTTLDGTNADLGDPIRSALRGMGYAVADPIEPADADLAAVPDASFEALFAQAERNVVAKVLNHWTGVDEKSGQDSQALSQYRDQLVARLRDLDAAIAAGRSSTGGGVVVAPLKAGRTRPGTLGFGDPRRWPSR